MINRLIKTAIEVCSVQSLDGRNYRQICTKSIIYHELRRMGYSLNGIAQMFGVDHASVHNLLKKYDDRLAYDREFRNLVELFKNKRKIWN